MSPEEIGGGPYREAGDPNAMALENMRKQIEAEKKHGIFLRDDIKIGSKIPEFIELLDQKIKLKDIAFYSSDTGILELGIGGGEIKTVPSRPGHEYDYENKKFPIAHLWVWLDKKRRFAVISNLVKKFPTKK